MSDPSAERLEGLRRAAFGRDATQADLDAWAAEEGAPPAAPLDHGSPAAPSPEDVAPEASPDGTDPPSEEVPVETPTLASRRGRLIALPIAAGVVGLLAGVAIGGAALAPERASSLTVFDQPAPDDDPRSLIFDSQNGVQSDGRVPWYQVYGDQRLLREGDDFRVWGALATENVGPAGPSGWKTVVCLSVEFSDGTGSGTCVPLEEFAADGIRVPSPLESDDRVFAWGPTGGLVVEPANLTSLLSPG